MGTTRIEVRLAAPRAAVYRALVDPRAIQAWRVPPGMTSVVHEHEAREGGRFRVSLTYEDRDHTGKTTGPTDTYHGHFARLVPDAEVVEVLAFESEDPAMQGEMTIMYTLADADGGGTVLTVVHDGVPAGVAEADNALGWRQSLEKLANLVERPGAVRQLSHAETASGYDAWSETYDEAGNPMVAASEWALDRAPLDCAGLDVVELGCGTGRHLARVLAAGARSYLGVDPSRGMLERARARFVDPRARFLEGDATALAPASCDLVLVVLVLEHVTDLAGTMRAIARALRPRGRLRIVEIHPSLVAAGTVAHFAAGDAEVRFASTAHEVPALRAAIADAGMDVTSLAEHAASGELLEAVPRLGKHRDRRVLLEVTARASILLVLAACGGRSPAAEAPDYRPVPTVEAPARAALYGDCLADAIASGRYGHARDPDTSLLLFTCTGDAARAFYDGLAAWSAQIGSEFASDGRTYRSTARVREDLFGVDYCATDGASHECVITLNVGEFVSASP